MRHVATLIATTYQTSLTTGRTTPGVFICEDANGNSAGEYVVKLKSNLETGNAGLLRETVGNLLANELGIDAPEPAIVEIPIELADGVADPRVAQAVQQSIGLNFGSKNLSGGYYAWPDEKTVPTSLKQLANDIFVFDALIQNPDRRRGKPNPTGREQAFSPAGRTGCLH